MKSSTLLRHLAPAIVGAAVLAAIGGCGDKKSEPKEANKTDKTAEELTDEPPEKPAADVPKEVAWASATSPDTNTGFPMPTLGLVKSDTDSDERTIQKRYYYDKAVVDEATINKGIAHILESNTEWDGKRPVGVIERCADNEGCRSLWELETLDGTDFQVETNLPVYNAEHHIIEVMVMETP